MFLPESSKDGSKNRRRLMPGQGRLLWASGLIAVGSFLPWMSTVVGNISGARGMGAGYWTFIVAMIGVSGGLLPFRRVAIGHAIVVAVVAIALPVWQMVHMYSLVGFEGWMPGIGIVMVFFGGVFAVGSARTLLSLERVPSEPQPVPA